MRTVLHALLFALLLALPAAADAGSPRVLVLGSPGFLDARGLAAMGLEVLEDPGDKPLADLAVVLLANIPFRALPGSVQQGLTEYVQGGGALWLTGGPQAFGSGGYQAAAALVPFELRSASDWRAIPFRPPVVLQPGHPILAGVQFGTIGAVNDMNPRAGAVEILRAAGGGSAGTGSYPYPLIAEMAVGAGRVLGMAFDPGDPGSLPDRARFADNVLRYLLATSRAGRGGS
ncbi:MAG: hypothetical protein ACE147_04990 [Candidatus Methylomirabilales bacterium]